MVFFWVNAGITKPRINPDFTFASLAFTAQTQIRHMFALIFRRLANLDSARWEAKRKQRSGGAASVAPPPSETTTGEFK
jgi:hypothetical protein